MPKHIIVLEEWLQESVSLPHRLIFDAEDNTLHFQFTSWDGSWQDCDGGIHTPIINKEEQPHAAR